MDDLSDEIQIPSGQGDPTLSSMTIDPALGSQMITNSCSGQQIMVHFSDEQNQDNSVVMDNTVSFEKIKSKINHEYSAFDGQFFARYIIGCRVALC